MQRCLVSKRESNHSEVPPHAHRGDHEEGRPGAGPWTGSWTGPWTAGSPPPCRWVGGRVRCSLQHGPPASRSRSSLLPSSPDSTSVRGADGGTQSPLSGPCGSFWSGARATSAPADTPASPCTPKPPIIPDYAPGNQCAVRMDSSWCRAACEHRATHRPLCIWTPLSRGDTGWGAGEGTCPGGGKSGRSQDLGLATVPTPGGHPRPAARQRQGFRWRRPPWLASG